MVTGIVIGVIVLALAIGALVLRRKGYSGMGGSTIVRCSKGHLFTTTWVPGASLKSIRLGMSPGREPVAARVEHAPFRG